MTIETSYEGPSSEWTGQVQSLCDSIVRHAVADASHDQVVVAQPRKGEKLEFNCHSDEGTLQDRFLRFKRQRQQEMRNRLHLQKKRGETMESRDRMALRRKFIETAKSYFGVPYHQRYHEPGDEHFGAPLYLDCCALVRQCVSDMKEDFGFSLARWNQAYQWDTLPCEIPFEDAQPGDLVFIKGTYYNENSKPQRHDIVHVEIFTGGQSGEETIGARWQKGVVQFWDSYKFEAKSYQVHSYHFKSIDTWLDGVLRSHCAEHTWQRSDIAWLPDEKSIFSSEADPDCCQADISDLGGAREQDGRRRFYVGKGNNWRIVADALTKLGWAQIPHQHSFTTEYDLRWVELRSQIDYSRFREGEQLVNHIPNNTVITTKTGLLETLREAGGECIDSTGRGHGFFPQSYNLDLPKDRVDLYDALGHDNDAVWIVKPSEGNRGRGIRVVDDPEVLKEELALLSKRADSEGAPSREETRRLSKRLVQRYIRNPLLLEGRKFDIRAYMFIANTTPYVVLYHEGYLRVSLEEYCADGRFDDVYVHLTNAAIQKTHEDKSRYAKSFIWTFDELEEYLVGNGLAPQGFVSGSLTGQMKGIMKAVFEAARDKLERRKGYFDLLGCDFMVDTNLKVWLIEVNTNPALHTDSPKLLRLLPKLVENTIRVAIEEFEGQGDRAASDYSPFETIL